MNRKRDEAAMRRMARNLRREEQRVLADPRHAALVEEAQREVEEMRAQRAKAREQIKQFRKDLMADARQAQGLERKVLVYQARAANRYLVKECK